MTGCWLLLPYWPTRKWLKPIALKKLRGDTSYVVGPTSKPYVLHYFLCFIQGFWFVLLSRPAGATGGGSIHRGYRWRALLCHDTGNVDSVGWLFLPYGISLPYFTGKEIRRPSNPHGESLIRRSAHSMEWLRAFFVLRSQLW